MAPSSTDSNKNVEKVMNAPAAPVPMPNWKKGGNHGHHRNGAPVGLVFLGLSYIFVQSFRLAA